MGQTSVKTQYKIRYANVSTTLTLCSEGNSAIGMKEKERSTLSYHYQSNHTFLGDSKRLEPIGTHYII